MRAFVIGVLILLGGTRTGVAQSQKFVPYEAIVESAEPLRYRSGPGTKFYPAGVLKKGDRVTVHRHDPGGWFMIAPPQGAFSWILGEHIERAGENRGIVNKNNAVVRVGAYDSDIHEVDQRRLSKGDEVRILGEKMLAGVNGESQLWYKISPPPNEWRWVLGQYITPVNKPSSSTGPTDPFADGPLAGKRPSKAGSKGELAGAGKTVAAKPLEGGLDQPTDDNGQLIERPIARRDKRRAAATVVKNDERQQKIDQAQRELDRLDVGLQNVLQQDPATWEFAELEQGYARLRPDVASTSLVDIIDARLLNIGKYRQQRAEADELARIAKETADRDAALAALQKQQEAKFASRSKAIYDGAGIVQRSTGKVPGAPAYVLLAPNNRVLAYLQPAAGVDIESWVGRSVGVNGQRAYRAELSTDLIVVRELATVRLAP